MLSVYLARSCSVQSLLLQRIVSDDQVFGGLDANHLHVALPLRREWTNFEIAKNLIVMVRQHIPGAVGFICVIGDRACRDPQYPLCSH